MGELLEKLQEDLAVARAELSATRSRRRYAVDAEQPFIDDDVAYWKGTIADLEASVAAEQRNLVAIADLKLTSDLRSFGLTVENIIRTPTRLVVTAVDGRGNPVVAVVNAGLSEHDEAFARLATKVAIR